VRANITVEMVSRYGMSSYISDKMYIPLLYQVFKSISISNICKNDGVYDIQGYIHNNVLLGNFIIVQISQDVLTQTR
jgi:hypothetical protein